MDLFSAQEMLHDEAVYIHGAQQYHVDRLDWERRKAYVQPVKVDYYTDAQRKVELKTLEAEDGRGDRHLGDAFGCINEKILKGGHVGLFAAYADLGASFAFCRLLALKTKHGFFLSVVMILF